MVNGGDSALRSTSADLDTINGELEIIAACAMLPEPDELLARLGLCTETIVLPPDTVDADTGAMSVICGTRLVNGRCPFHAHHAAP